jgi:alpha-beta hydrolase superfamily lysophospholipase
VRSFAESAAKIGVPTLRFDYSGTGDSAELDPRADQLEKWVQDVIAAAAELRRIGGVERVYLLGFRLGALLATLAAARCRTISGLILVSPILSGRRYLRELRTVRLASSIGAESSAPWNELSTSAVGTDAIGMEVGGFTYSAATLASLARVDLKAQAAPPADQMLVIDGSSMPVARAWAEDLSGRGIAVKYQALPGLIEMVMTAPQFATVPREMVAAMGDWLAPMLKKSQSERLHTEEAEPRNFSAGLISEMTLPDCSTAESLLTERPVFIESRATLFGVVAESHCREPRSGAVIFVNAGADFHIGASGMYVDLSRRWARRGFVALRIDLAGLGDSATVPGEDDNVVFPPSALDDIRAAVEWVRQQYALIDITLCGVCSGAYHVLRAAAAELPVKGVLMVNPETFFWDEAASIYDMNLAEVVKGPAVNREKVLSAGAWKRLLRGQIDIGYHVRRNARRLFLAMESVGRDVARRLRIRLPRDLGRELEEIAGRGVRMAFIFSRGEPGITLLKMLGGSSLNRLHDSCHVHIIDGADHTFSKLEARTALEDKLSEELFASRH